jgi:hypothetical protein
VRRSAADLDRGRELGGAAGERELDRRADLQRPRPLRASSATSSLTRPSVHEITGNLSNCADV